MNPENEFQGSKYTPGLGTKEIAKRIRQDISAAKKNGTLPSMMKTTVRMERYSLGSSIHIRVTYLPFNRYNQDLLEVAYQKGGPSYLGPFDYDEHGTYTDQAKEVLNTLRGIMTAYRRDNSDIQTDYFDWNFHGTVEFDVLNMPNFGEAYESYKNARNLCKSPIIREAAEENGWEVQEADVSSMTNEDMRGLPNANPFGGVLEDDGEYTFYASNV